MKLSSRPKRRLLYRRDVIRTPSTAELLDAWEQGLGRPLVWQAVFLLATVCPGVPIEALTQLSIGQRDAILLALRERVFGSAFTGLARCPTCSEQLELMLNTADIQVAEATAVTRETCQPKTWLLTADGYEILFRLPGSRDLALLPEQADPLVARQQLLQQCILSVSHHGSVIAPTQLPVVVAEAVVEQMGQVDPQGNIELALTCPCCNHCWSVPFDIAHFLGAELHHWALRLLYEVHLLAQAYGWSECDILALSPWRRHYYLNMVKG